MKQDKTTIWKEPKIKVAEPIKLCKDCQHYSLKAAETICADCLLSTSKAINWVKK